MSRFSLRAAVEQPRYLPQNPRQTRNRGCAGNRDDHDAGIVPVTRGSPIPPEWIASDSPVCPLDDMASPKRWAQPSLISALCPLCVSGIAGEDDLDAPDLNARKPANPTLRRHHLMAGAVAAKNIGLKKRRTPSSPPMIILILHFTPEGAGLSGVARSTDERTQRHKVG